MPMNEIPEKNENETTVRIPLRDRLRAYGIFTAFLLFVVLVVAHIAGINSRLQLWGWRAFAIIIILLIGSTLTSITMESFITRARWQLGLMVLASVSILNILARLSSSNEAFLGAAGVLVILAGVLLRMAAIWERNHQNSKNWEAEKRPAYWVVGLAVMWSLGAAINYLKVNVTPKSNFPHEALCYVPSSTQEGLPNEFHCYAVLTQSWSYGWAVLSLLVIVALIAGTSVWLFWSWSRDEVQKLRSDVERMNRGGPTNDELKRKHREAAAEVERHRQRTMEETRQQLDQDEFNRRGYP